MSNGTDYNVEFAHVYLEGKEISRNADPKRSIFFTRSILDQLHSQRFSYTTSVLIDDYSLGQRVTLSEGSIKSHFRSWGMTPDYISCESSFVNVAEDIIEAIPPKFLWKTGGRLLFRCTGFEEKKAETSVPYRRFKTVFMSGMRNVATAEDATSRKLQTVLKGRRQIISETLLYHEEGKQRMYSCPLLASAWYLARLGIEPFYSALRKNCFGFPVAASQLLNVLSIDYIGVESSVRELMGFSRNKKFRNARNRIQYFFY